MYLCYVDESGFNGKKYNQAQPVQTMIGIFPNVYNYHKSDSEFKKVFEIISQNIPIKELKAADIYRGRKRWKEINPEIRDRVIDYYINWICERNHNFIVTAIDNKKFFELKKHNNDQKVIKHFPYPWILSAFQIALVIQKLNRNKPKNKGKSLLIFDEEDIFADHLCELIHSPPEFIDEFVKFEQKREGVRLNQIIDSAYFVKSHHSSMAQVVDILAFIYRLHLELNFYGLVEAYDGEREKINNWISLVQNKFIRYSVIYPKPTRNKYFLQLLDNTRANGAKW